LPIVPKILLLVVLRKDSIVLYHYILRVTDCYQLEDSYEEEQFDDFFTGRAALQKRIMALLRKIEHCVNGVQPVSIDLLFESKMYLF
jgi:hypothetical protein